MSLCEFTSGNAQRQAANAGPFLTWLAAARERWRRGPVALVTGGAGIEQTRLELAKSGPSAADVSVERGCLRLIGGRGCFSATSIGLRSSSASLAAPSFRRWFRNETFGRAVWKQELEIGYRCSCLRWIDDDLNISGFYCPLVRKKRPLSWCQVFVIG